MSGYAIWPSIVAGSAVGAMTMALLLWGPFRKLKSTNQLRWVLGFLVGFGVALGYGAVALNQGNSNPTSTKVVYWANQILVGLAVTGLLTVTCLGIFSDFGARLAVPMLTFLGFTSYGVGAFVIDASARALFYSFGTVFIVLAGVLLFLVDRLDVIASLPTKNREPIGKFPGLIWRILTLVVLIYFIIFTALGVNYYAVLSPTGQQISDAFGVLAAFIILFINWIVVEGVDPIYDGTTLANGARDRESVASVLRGSS